MGAIQGAINKALAITAGSSLVSKGRDVWKEKMDNAKQRVKSQIKAKKEQKKSLIDSKPIETSMGLISPDHPLYNKINEELKKGV